MPRIPAIDPDCCIGCEACTQVCPEVFHMVENENANGHAHGHEKAAVHNPTGAPEAKIEQAMDNCPSACIYWQ